MPRGTPNTPKPAAETPSTQAIHNPVVIHKTIESGNTTPGQSEPRVMRSEGDAMDALDKVESVIKVTDTVGDPEKAAMLAFMNEMIDVRIATSTAKDAEQIIEINVNGYNAAFRRGVTKTVPRFIADRLARVKITGYEQKEVTNSEGVRQFVHTPVTGLRYDFSVTRDPSPHADAWLRSVIAERG